MPGNEIRVQVGIPYQELTGYFLLKQEVFFYEQLRAFTKKNHAESPVKDQSHMNYA